MNRLILNAILAAGSGLDAGLGVYNAGTGHWGMAALAFGTAVFCVLVIFITKEA